MGTVGLCFLACKGQKTPETKTSAALQTNAKKNADFEPHAEVTAFISTRCPHAAETMNALLLLKKEMGDALSLHVGYIGALDAKGNIDRAVGEDEIQAAAMQICAGIGKSTTEESWFAFLNCLYKDNSWRALPGGIKQCMETVGIDSAAADACMASKEGEKLLVEAYRASSASRIQTSPTVIVDRHFYAGARDADSLRQYLCYTAGVEETRPASCDRVPPPKKIGATMLYDSRCKSALKCDVEGEIAVLEKLIPGFTLDRFEFSTDIGRALYAHIKDADPQLKMLPLILIDNALDERESLKSMLGEYLVPFEDGYIFALGGGWDPLAEICDNEKDDNENGAVDCADPACAPTRLCREEIKGRLDLFIMSGCPYALDLLPHADKLLHYFDRSRKNIDFHLQFIGDIGESGGLTSMHGEAEVAEDLRMICAQALYPDNYKFMEYVTCRAASFESTNWEDCVPEDMSKADLKACAEGKQGETLLRESFIVADALGVEGSPSFILNNKEDMNARRLPDMVVKFCNKNDIEACKKPLTEKEASPPPSHRCE